MLSKVEEKLICEIDQIPPRARNALAEAGVVTVGDLLKMTFHDIESLPYMGKVSVTKIKDYLASQGLWLEKGGHSFRVQKSRIIEDIEKWAPKLTPKDLLDIRSAIDKHLK